MSPISREIKLLEDFHQRVPPNTELQRVACDLTQAVARQWGLQTPDRIVEAHWLELINRTFIKVRQAPPLLNSLLCTLANLRGRKPTIELTQLTAHQFHEKLLEQEPKFQDNVRIFEEQYPETSGYFVNINKKLAQQIMVSEGANLVRALDNPANPAFPALATSLVCDYHLSIHSRFWNIRSSAQWVTEVIDNQEPHEVLSHWVLDATKVGLQSDSDSIKRMLERVRIVELSVIGSMLSDVSKPRTQGYFLERSALVYYLYSQLGMHVGRNVISKALSKSIHILRPGSDHAQVWYERD